MIRSWVAFGVAYERAAVQLGGGCLALAVWAHLHMRPSFRLWIRVW